MRCTLTCLIALYSFTCTGQNLEQLQQQFYEKLNSGHGWGLTASKDNNKTDITYVTQAWFSFTPDKKLEYSKTEVKITGNQSQEPKVYTTTIPLKNIKSIGYKEEEYINKTSATLNQENVKSPRLLIYYAAGGETHLLTAGFQTKGNKNLIAELNQLIKAIQKQL